MIACAARVMCAKKFLIGRYIFHMYYKYGVLVFGDDGIGPVDEFKRTKCVQGWSCKLWEGAIIICNAIIL